MSFCTVINCMDGRVQLPVINFLQKRFGAQFVDSITEAGPNLILAKQDKPELVQSIMNRINISVEKHQSVGIAVVGHHDCAGNPVQEAEQMAHIRDAVRFLRKQYAGMEVIGLWVDQDWEVNEVVCDDKSITTTRGGGLNNLP